MNQRTVLTTLGAIALGVGVLFGGATSSYAQDTAIPPAAAAAYDSFVSAVADELGADEAAVDAAIRSAVTQAIDDRLADGKIDE